MHVDPPITSHPNIWFRYLQQQWPGQSHTPYQTLLLHCNGTIASIRLWVCVVCGNDLCLKIAPLQKQVATSAWAAAGSCPSQHTLRTMLPVRGPAAFAVEGPKGVGVTHQLDHGITCRLSVHPTDRWRLQVRASGI